LPTTSRTKLRIAALGPESLLTSLADRQGKGGRRGLFSSRSLGADPIPAHRFILADCRAIHFWTIRRRVSKALIQELPAPIAFLSDVQALRADVGEFGSVELHDSPPSSEPPGSFWLRLGCGFCRILPESAELEPLFSMESAGIKEFLIRRSQVRVLPRLPFLSSTYAQTSSGVPTFVPTFSDEFFFRAFSNRSSMASAACRETLSRTYVQCSLVTIGLP